MSNFKIIKLNATTSTNDYLKKRYKSGKVLDGDLVWTENQTSGRGQLNKKWISEPFKSLTFSVYRQFNGLLIKPFKFNAVVCLGIIYALKKLGIPGLSIKWPNDILSENKKIGGILIENFFNRSRINASVIGIGLNLNQEKFEKLPKATSLKIITGKKWSSKIILDALVPLLDEYLFMFDFKDSSILDQYQKILWKRNKTILFDMDGKLYKGKLKGVDESGMIILQDQEKMIRKFNNSQISIQYGD
ncbi:biotin--[acetyl-CoA-carboxylase] ligase [Bacteroidetes bacterium SCGC AAA795-G10]|nr:biotin--[acetyl-CoA-carboxylase] ligase [Bacteroidetes bacterium SCGC AAA795-G10]